MKFKKFIPFISIAIVGTGYVQKKKIKIKKVLPKYFVEIPAGHVYDKLYSSGLTILKNAHPKLDSTQQFYISETEVTNHQYGLYLKSLKRSARVVEYNKALPDTNVWVDILASPEPYAQYYFRHQAYRNYPLVGVTQEQAIGYCQWLTDSLNQANQNYEITIKIPTRSEWVRAARGDDQYRMYTMPGNALRNKDGNYLYNHRVVGEQNIYLNHETKQFEVIPRNCLMDNNRNDMALITAESKSYWPNEFGTYNMCGNVAELISDDTIALGGSWYDPGFDIRIESEKPATKPSCLIGFRVIAYINLHE